MNGCKYPWSSLQQKGLTLGGSGFAVANRISSTNACPHHLLTTPQRCSTSTTKSVPRLLHPTRRVTLPRVHLRTRPRRGYKILLSTIRHTLHPIITLMLGMKVDRLSVPLPHGVELWFLAQRPGRRARVVPVCASAHSRIRMCLLKSSRARVRG